MKKITFTLLMILFILTLGGCSFFSEEAEGVKDITFEETEEGDVKVFVYYYDDGETVKEEIIPHGLDGKDGVGVESIQVVREAEARRSKVIITLDEGTTKEFYVPDGVRISQIESKYDKGTDEYYMYVTYSDGEVSDGILLPRGRDGIGLDTTKSEVTTNEDGSITIKWIFTDETEKEFVIPVGKPGVGIKKVTPSEDGGTYNFSIEYTDGNIEKISFTRTSIWFMGYGAPTLATNAPIVENAMAGDFYLDLYGKKIYRFSDTWDLLVDFAQATETYTVKFMANDSELAPANAFQNEITNVLFGTCLVGRIPIPTRPGYKFVGWATSDTLTQVTGYFTELTPVTMNLTLYAIWETE